MSGRAVALWGAQIRAGENIVAAAEFADLPVPIVITMAAIDPTAEPTGDGPKRATLKIIRRPISSMYDDMEGESDEDSEDEESEEEAPKKKGGKKDKMDVDGKKGGLESLSDDEDEEGLELEEFVVCTLDAENTYQQPLTLTISDSEDIFFRVTGAYDVYLTGNYVDYSHDHGHDHDEDDESDEDYDLSPSEDELDGDSDSEDELDNLENPRIQELVSDEEAAAPKKAEKKDKKAEKKDSKKRAAEETPEKPAEGGKQKKAKANDGKAVAVETPTKKEDQKKVKFAKNLEQGPSPAAASKKEEPKKADKKKEDKKEEKKADGPRKVNGVTIDDKTVGTGAQAKPGQKVNMRYVGKLTNGKVFDSNTKGKPFTFTLGKGEVIKGWDIGIQGMQQGGERRITIPAELAYGKKALPGIPANSTLCFDVKLLGIK